MPIPAAMTDLRSTGDELINDTRASVDDLMADTSAAAEQAASSVKTFRGRSLEELIPRIRGELGSDAIVVRSGEGLTGGILGFFQKRYVEVDARAPLAHERPDGDLSRNDRATAEGLATPGMKALIDQAHPFSAQLASAQAAAAGRAAKLSEADAVPASFMADPLPTSAGLYGPQPNLEAMRDVAAAIPAAAAECVSDESDPPVDVVDLDDPRDGVPPGTVDGPVVVDHHLSQTVAPVVAPADRTPVEGVERIRARLVESGLAADLAADVVGEAVDHFLPFADARPFETHVRTVLTRRLVVLSDLGPGSRTLAFLGPADVLPARAAR
jgi:hypothetical protein